MHFQLQLWSTFFRDKVSELQVEVCTSRAEHRSIESIVVYKATDHFQAQTLPVHGDGSEQVGDGGATRRWMDMGEEWIWCGLTFELSWRQRRGALDSRRKMGRSPSA